MRTGADVPAALNGAMNTRMSETRTGILAEEAPGAEIPAAEVLREAQRLKGAMEGVLQEARRPRETVEGDVM